MANFVGRAWAAFLGIALIPIYIRFVGIESYGLIAFGSTLFSVFSLLDMGFSSTLNREMASLNGKPDATQDSRDVLATLQLVYLIGSACAALLVVLAAPYIATHWLNATTLGIPTVQRAIYLMGFVVALQMVSGFYTGGLLGLQRQVLANSLMAFMGTLRSAGAVVVLWAVSPTVEAFFAWQAICGAIGAIVTAVALWRSLPHTGTPGRFRSSLLSSSGRFAFGMGATSLVGLALNQADKLVLSKLLSLEAFAYYALASLVASALHHLGSPIFTTFFPSLTHRVASGDEKGLIQQYQKATEALAVAVMPVAGVLAFFSAEVLFAWTNDPITVREVRHLLSLLSIATALSLLASIPYCLQLAYGWTQLGLAINTLSAVIVVPTVFFAAKLYGAVGAAAVMVGLNFIYLFAFVHLMHVRVLQSAKLHWYTRGLARPVLAIGLVAIAGKIGFGVPQSREIAFLEVAVLYVAMLGCTVLGAPHIKAAVRTFVRRSGPND